MTSPMPDCIATEAQQRKFGSTRHIKQLQKAQRACLVFGNQTASSMQIQKRARAQHWPPAIASAQELESLKQE